MRDNPTWARGGSPATAPLPRWFPTARPPRLLETEAQVCTNEGRHRCRVVGCCHRLRNRPPGCATADGGRLGARVAEREQLHHRLVALPARPDGPGAGIVCRPEHGPICGTSGVASRARSPEAPQLIDRLRSLARAWPGEFVSTAVLSLIGISCRWLTRQPGVSALLRGKLITAGSVIGLLIHLL